MNTLRRPALVTLLDELHADAARADAPLMAQLHALPADERRALMLDYARLYDAAKEAYLPIDRAAGDLLYLLARARGATTIVEFGTSFGLSTIVLAAALRDGGGGRLITCELVPSKAAQARRNLERAGLADLVEIRVGDALETLREVPRDIDFVYLDGAKTLYRPILALLEPRLAERAIVVADNLAMADLVAEFTTHVRDPSCGYVAVSVPIGDGIEVAMRAGGDVSRLAAGAPSRSGSRADRA